MMPWSFDPPLTPEVIELRPAAWWECETCGHDHFIRCVEKSVGPDGSPAGDEYAWLSHPAEVRCDICGSVFAVEYAEPAERDVPAVRGRGGVLASLPTWVLVVQMFVFLVVACFLVVLYGLAMTGVLP